MSLENIGVVVPGEPTHILVSATNIGTTVEAYDLTVLGPLAPFTTIDPTELRLLPGQNATATITIRAGASLQAGAVPFAVKVQPRTSPTGSAIAEQDLEVAPLTDFEIRPIPLVLRVRRRGSVAIEIENKGNAPLTVNLAIQDPNQDLTVSLRPSSVTIPPQGTATATAKLLSMAPRGAVVDYGIHGRTWDGQERRADARMEMRRRRPGRLIALAAAAMLVLIALVALNGLDNNDAVSLRTGATTFDAAETTTSVAPAAEAPLTTLTPTSEGAIAPTTGTAGPQSIPEAPAPASSVAPPPAVQPVPRQPETTRQSTTTSIFPRCGGEDVNCVTVPMNSKDNVLTEARWLYGAKVTAFSQPSHGNAYLVEDNTKLLYTPNPGYLGPDKVFFSTDRPNSTSTYVNIRVTNG